jgi:hypothetical protein
MRGSLSADATEQIKEEQMGICSMHGRGEKYTISVGHPEEKRRVGRSRGRREYSIKVLS